MLNPHNVYNTLALRSTLATHLNHTLKHNKTKKQTKQEIFSYSLFQVAKDSTLKDHVIPKYLHNISTPHSIPLITTKALCSHLASLSQNQLHKDHILRKCLDAPQQHCTSPQKTSRPTRTDAPARPLSQPSRPEGLQLSQLLSRARPIWRACIRRCRRGRGRMI